MGKVHMLFCDDDDQVRSYYEKLILNHINIDGFQLHLFSSPAELFKDKSLIMKADLILLDVCMEGMDGIHAAELIRKFNDQIKIIFISTSADYVFDSFKVHPLNYILKNNNTDGELIILIQETLESCVASLDEEGFECYNIDRVVILRIEDIVSFEIINRQIVVHSAHGNYTTRVPLQELIEKFEPRGFEKTTRSCIVNMQHILRIEGCDVYMRYKYKFPIAYRNRTLFKENFQKYLLSKNKKVK